MGKLFCSLIIAIIIWATLQNCASQISPTGGEKDTIPPTLIRANPPNLSTNFNKDKIDLYFDEFIDGSKIASELYVTPSVKAGSKIKYFKNQVQIKLKEQLKDSTTYLFNFGEGLKDANEGSINDTLIYIISTGSYIDSLKISGIITSLFEQKPMENFIVGLYDLSVDTINILKSKPYFFTKSKKDGSFLFQNIKHGTYLLNAFDDSKKNLQLDPFETYAFYSDTINLKKNIDSIFIQSLKLNFDTISIISSLISGKYYEVKFNKPVTSYNIIPINKVIKHYPAILMNENKTLRFYNPDSTLNDTTLILLQYEDLIGFSKKDTIPVNFKESKRKSQPFKTGFKKKYLISGDSIYQKITFSKPIKTYTPKLCSFMWDTFLIRNVTKNEIILDSLHSKATLNVYNLNKIWIKNQIDSLVKLVNTMNDSLVIDTTKQIPLNFKLQCIKNAFVSVEQDSSENVNISYEYKKLNLKDGTIAGEISTKYSFYIVQLLNKNYKVIQEIVNPKKEYLFKAVTPGTYQIRVLIDTNKNKKWDIGNILQRAEPEPIFFYKEKIILKANWEFDEIDLKF